MKRRKRWFDRLFFPARSTLPLGEPGELWRPEAQLPGYSALIAAAKKKGLTATPSHDLTQHLLPDVVDAAVGAEYVASGIAPLIGQAEAWAASFPWGSHGASVTRGAHHIAIGDAYTEFTNLLVWIRAVGDRVERRQEGQLAGLLPALDPALPLTGQVDDLMREFERKLLKDVRKLAGYALHQSRIPYPMNLGAAWTGKRLLLKIPNRETSMRYRVPFELRYGQKRTVSSFVRRAMPIVRTFIDDLLAAFEAEVPTRVRR